MAFLHDTNRIKVGCTCVNILQSPQGGIEMQLI